MHPHIIPRLFRYSGLALAVAGSILGGCAVGLSPIDWPLPNSAGTPSASVGSGELTFANKALAAKWSVRDGRFSMVEFTDRAAKQTINFAKLPALYFKNDNQETLDASQFVVVGRPDILKLKADPKGVRLADRIPGRAIRVALRHPARQGRPALQADRALPGSARSDRQLRSRENIFHHAPAV
jgi:hypothetical protein